MKQPKTQKFCSVQYRYYRVKKSEEYIFHYHIANLTLSAETGLG